MEMRKFYFIDSKMHVFFSHFNISELNVSYYWCVLHNRQFFFPRKECKIMIYLITSGVLDLMNYDILP